MKFIKSIYTKSLGGLGRENNASIYEYQKMNVNSIISIEPKSIS